MRYYVFQSTPLREGRLRKLIWQRNVSGFNPRPCARGDVNAWLDGIDFEGFNPRPCARGDPTGLDVSWPNLVFQSTPLREGRPDRAGVLLVHDDVSIHAPARGATTSPKASLGIISSFNPRPCARGDSLWAQ